MKLRSLVVALCCSVALGTAVAGQLLGDVWKVIVAAGFFLLAAIVFKPSNRQFWESSERPSFQRSDRLLIGFIGLMFVAAGTFFLVSAVTTFTFSLPNSQSVRIVWSPITRSLTRSSRLSFRKPWTRTAVITPRRMEICLPVRTTLDIGMEVNGSIIIQAVETESLLTELSMSGGKPLDPKEVYDQTRWAVNKALNVQGHFVAPTFWRDSAAPNSHKLNPALARAVVSSLDLINRPSVQDVSWRGSVDGHVACSLPTSRMWPYNAPE